MCTPKQEQNMDLLSKDNTQKIDFRSTNQVHNVHPFLNMDIRCNNSYFTLHLEIMALRVVLCHIFDIPKGNKQA